MGRLQERDYTYFRTIRGMCRQCRTIVPARVFFRDGSVWQQSLCPHCDNDSVLIADDQDWYLRQILQPSPDHSPLIGARKPQQGCPHDCGPCSWHASPCQLPVVSITNACNLDCPICFTYNRNDKIYHMSPSEMRNIVDWIITSSAPVDLINITGGEPTLHPRLMELLHICQRPEIGRVTLNSNGLTLAHDYTLCQQLAELNVYVVLSINSFDADVSRQMHGRDIIPEKHRALENLLRAGVKVTLLNVLVQDLNESTLGQLLELMDQYDNILSLTVQTMTYTGQGGSRFPRTRHVPVDLAAKKLCDYSNGLLTFTDFVRRPAAHPLCYLVCYLLKDKHRLVPFMQFASAERITALIQDSYLMGADGGQDFFTGIISQLYAENNRKYLGVLRRLVETLYPPKRHLSHFERQRLAESSVRTIYIHAHMDEDTFDCSRAVSCPDLVPVEPGRLIPACTYNLFYRQKDERFFSTRDKHL